MKLIRWFEDLKEGEDVDSWFWIGRRFKSHSGDIGPNNFLGWYIYIALPLFQFSGDNFDQDSFEKVQGWSVPVFEFRLRWNGFSWSCARRYLGPSEALNTNDVYDPETHEVEEQYIVLDDGNQKIEYHVVPRKDKQETVSQCDVLRAWYAKAYVCQGIRMPSLDEMIDCYR
jgi:hypothetical protein